jgi:hypothetical protein
MLYGGQQLAWWMKGVGGGYYRQDSEPPSVSSTVAHVQRSRYCNEKVSYCGDADGWTTAHESGLCVAHPDMTGHRTYSVYICIIPADKTFAQPRCEGCKALHVST